MYYAQAPTNFSIFCTQAEREFAEEYVRKKQSEPSKPRRSREDDEYDLNKPPAPRKEHNYCHLCLTRYNEYFSHVSSELHQRRFKSNSKVYMQVNDLFGQINSYWREEKEKEKQKELQELKDLEFLLNQYEDNAELENALFNTNEIVSTKFGTNVVNNIDIASQIVSAQVYIPEEKEMEDFIKEEMKLDNIDIEETLIENANELILKTEIPPNFVDNNQKDSFKGSF